jgi:hypothetical protein
VTHDEAVHAAEADLRRLGWVVYRRVLGSGPDLAAWRDWWSTGPVLVAVKRPKPAKGRLYPRVDRMDGAGVLASVLEEGRVEYRDDLGRLLSLSGLDPPSSLLPRGVGGAVQDGPLPSGQPAE